MNGNITVINMEQYIIYFQEYNPSTDLWERKKAYAFHPRKGAQEEVADSFYKEHKQSGRKSEIIKIVFV